MAEFYELLDGFPGEFFLWMLIMWLAWIAGKLRGDI